MKKIFVVVLILTSIQALATRARYKALNSSLQITDTQSEFTSPYHMFSIKDFVSFESGVTAATGTDDGAEALTKFSINENSKLLIAIGHKDEAIQTQRKFINAVANSNVGAAFSTQQNPVEVIYGYKGDWIWAGGLFYSNYKDKVNNNSESSAGLRLGAAQGGFKWKLNLGLTNKVENTTDGSFGNQPYVNAAVRYNVGDNHKFGFDYTTWNAKRDNTSGVETDSHTYQDFKFQYVNSTAKDGDDFFYGIAIDSLSLKNKINDKKLSRLALPVWIGFENQASDWLTLRATIKQTVFAQSKDENGYKAGAVDGAFGIADSDYSGEPNNTEVAAGLGFKFQQLTIDGTLAGLIGKTQTQQINSGNLLALAGVTYNF